MSKKNNQILSVHYFRGIAAVMVVLYHIRSHVGVSYSESLIGKMAVDIGPFGVDLFFIISGFIICLSTDKAENHYIKNFIIRRVFRIYPLLIISIIAFYFLIHEGKDVPMLLRSMIPLHSDYDAIPPWFGMNILGPAWTITYEIFFYSAFLICMVISHKNRSWATLLLMLSVFFAFSLYTGGVSLDATRIAQYRGPTLLKPLISISSSPIVINFVYGILLYHIFVIAKSITKDRLLKVIAAASIIAMVASISLLFSAEMSGHGPTKWGLVSLMILISGILIETTIGVRNFAPLILLGNISYSLYITHVITIRFIVNTGSISGLGDASKAAIFLAASLVVSYFCYIAIEKPFIRVSRKIIRS